MDFEFSPEERAFAEEVEKWLDVHATPDVADVTRVPARLTVIGSAPAGSPFSGQVGPGQAVRIFTGGAVPEGADAIVIQEDAEASGDAVTLKEAASPGRFIRPAGLDFQAGSVGLAAGRRLTARDIGLAARPVRRDQPHPGGGVVVGGDVVGVCGLGGLGRHERNPPLSPARACPVRQA